MSWKKYNDSSYNRQYNLNETLISAVEGCDWCYGHWNCYCAIGWDLDGNEYEYAYIVDCRYPCCDPYLEDFLEDEMYRLFKQDVKISKEKLLRILQIPSLKKQYLVML